MGSVFLGDGKDGPPRAIGVVMACAGVFLPEEPGFVNPVGGMPISLETVYGRS